MLLYSVLLPLAPLFAQTASGTSGVAIRTPGGVVLAMDSRVTLSGGGVQQRGPNECKIRRAGRFFVAIAGLYDHAPTRFDAWATARAAVAGARSVAEAVELAERRLDPELRAVIAELRAPAHLGVCVAGLDQNTPALACRAFLPERKDSSPWVRWDAPPGATSVFVMGESRAITQAYHEPRLLADLVESLGPLDAARRLVGLEITYESERVGPPVAVVQLAPGGAVWLQAGLCRAQ